MAEERTRIIYYGDNLDILRRHVPSESVDIVYLDPPFKSQQDYNLLFRTLKGEPATAQVRAFTDTWKWGLEAKATYERLMEDPLVPGKVAKMVEAFHGFLGPSEMLAYLVMMTPRLMELHRVLKPTGSLYLHCDPAASHYLKIVLDTVFGPQNFRNEISWRRSNPKSHIKVNFPNCRDVVLRYSKSGETTFNMIYESHDPEYVRKAYKYADSKGQYRLLPLLNPNDDRPNLTYEFLGVTRVWRWTRERMEQAYRDGVVVQLKPGAVPQYKKYLADSKGRTITDDWSDIEQAAGNEALGYPTQKPVTLLKRIIQASSNPGDLVLDPFCGCGTALAAAEELGRSWIGIDVTYLAVDVMARRLRDHFPGITFQIRGQPQDEEGARALAERDRFQFQVWALSMVEAQSQDPNSKGADRGIDGYLPFREGPDKRQRAIVQVKSGHVGVKEVRDLRGTLEREKAPFGVFITLEPPTEPMRREAAEAGFYRLLGTATDEQIPRIQILTIRQLLTGQKPRLPSTQESPVPRAPRLERARGRQLSLDREPQAEDVEARPD